MCVVHWICLFALLMAPPPPPLSFFNRQRLHARSVSSLSLGRSPNPVPVHLLQLRSPFDSSVVSSRDLRRPVLGVAVGGATSESRSIGRQTGPISRQASQPARHALPWRTNGAGVACGWWWGRSLMDPLDNGVSCARETLRRLSASSRSGRSFRSRNAPLAQIQSQH